VPTAVYANEIVTQSTDVKFMKSILIQ